jgi:hypothetical protein
LHFDKNELYYMDGVTTIQHTRERLRSGMAVVLHCQSLMGPTRLFLVPLSSPRGVLVSLEGGGGLFLEWGSPVRTYFDFIAAGFDIEVAQRLHEFLARVFHRARRRLGDMRAGEPSPPQGGRIEQTTTKKREGEEV